MNHIHSCYLKPVSLCPATLGSSPQDSLFLLHGPLPSQLPTEWVPSFSNVATQMYLGLSVLPWLLHPGELTATCPNHPHPHTRSHTVLTQLQGVAQHLWWLPTRVICISLTSFSSVQSLSCVRLCDPMDCSTPGLPVHHQFPEFTYTHVHWVGDPIQPSHPLLSLSPPTFSLSQHQGLFKWVSSSHQVAKVLEFQLQHRSFQWTFRTAFL